MAYAKALTIPENVRLCYLPLYSPELNPAEHLWDEIREKWFPNLVFHHMDGVEDALMEALIALEIIRKVRYCLMDISLSFLDLPPFTDLQFSNLL